MKAMPYIHAFSMSICSYDGLKKARGSCDLASSTVSFCCWSHSLSRARRYCPFLPGDRKRCFLRWSSFTLSRRVCGGLVIQSGDVAIVCNHCKFGGELQLLYFART